MHAGCHFQYVWDQSLLRKATRGEYEVRHVLDFLHMVSAHADPVPRHWLALQVRVTAYRGGLRIYFLQYHKDSHAADWGPDPGQAIS